MDEEDAVSIVARVKEALGMLSDGDTAHAIDAVLDGMGRLLTPEEAGAITQHLPPEFASVLSSASERAQTEETVGDVVSLVASREGLPASAAYETVKVTCEVLASYLPEDVVDKLQQDLPPEVGSLLVHTMASPSRRTSLDSGGVIGEGDSQQARTTATRPSVGSSQRSAPAGREKADVMRGLLESPLEAQRQPDRGVLDPVLPRAARMCAT